jgi:hypothetical protein
MTQYRVGNHGKNRRRRNVVWLVVSLIIIGFIVIGVIWVRQALRPKVIITQSKAVNTTVNFNPQTQLYKEPDFSVSLPTSWHVVPRAPGGLYQTFTWQSSDVGTNGQIIQMFEDTIPVNFAVNRVLIVQGEIDHLTLVGQASDNCSTFTKNPPLPSQNGAPAKWQGVSFLCDQRNLERDVIGTSSADGVNTVILENQDTGVKHKFFFTYTDYSTNPDYTVFYNTLNSFHMN